MECAQINLTGGSGMASPTTYSIPGIYKATDPGILINIYSMTPASTYVIPGGLSQVWNFSDLTITLMTTPNTRGWGGTDGFKGTLLTRGSTLCRPPRFLLRWQPIQRRRLAAHDHEQADDADDIDDVETHDGPAADHDSRARWMHRLHVRPVWRHRLQRLHVAGEAQVVQPL